MAIPQIEILPELIERRKMMYHYYDEHIRNTRVLRKPVVCSEACCIKYAILVKDKNGFMMRVSKKALIWHLVSVIQSVHVVVNMLLILQQRC